MFNFSKMWKTYNIRKNKVNINDDSYEDYDLHKDIWIRAMHKLKTERMLRDYDAMYVKTKGVTHQKNVVYINPLLSVGDSNSYKSPTTPTTPTTPKEFLSDKHNSYVNGSHRNPSHTNSKKI